VLSGVLAAAALVVVAAPSEAKIVANKVCAQVDPNLKSGQCIQNQAGDSVTWLGNFESSNGQKFFCIDYTFADSTNPVPPGTSMQNMKNRDGKQVPNGSLRVLGWVLQRHAPNGGAGDPVQNAAIQLLVREVMNDSGGFFSGPGGDFLRPGATVQPINGGSGWTTPGSILKQAKAYWNEGSKYYANQNGTYAVAVSLPPTVNAEVPVQGVITVTGRTNVGVPGLDVTTNVTGAGSTPISGKTNANGQFIITLTPSQSAANVTVKASVNGPTYANYFQPSGWPGNQKQRALFSSTANSAGSGSAVVPVIPKYGQVRAKKVSAVTGDALAGAVLRLKDGPTILGDWTTDASGLTPAVQIAVGRTVCVFELSPPPGYDPVDPNVALACEKLTVENTTLTITGQNTPTLLLIPTVVTTASDQQVIPGTPLSDEIVVGNTGGETIPATWTSFGPIPANKTEPDPCLNLDFTGAPEAATGSFTVTGDGTYTEGVFTPTGAASVGCYGYSVTLEKTATTENVTHGPDQENETTLVKETPVTPAVTTQVTEPQVIEGAIIWDDVTVTGTAGDPIDATITLYGPMAPDAATPSDPCATVAWAGAPVAATETFVITADGTTRHGEYGLDDLPGCYSYGLDLAASWSTNPVTFPPGDPAETVIVLDQPLTPGVITQAQPDLVVVPGTEVSDAIRVTNTGGATIAGGHWQLYGPLAPIISDDEPCEGLDWAPAPVLNSGDFTVSGPGDFIYNTPGTPVPSTGCYSFGVQLDATIFTDAVDFPAGADSETVIVKPAAAPPVITTTIDQAALSTDGTITDLVTVTGTEGNDFDLKWTLHGPVAPAAGADRCGPGVVDWGSAPIADSGTQQHTGDGTYTVGPVGPIPVEQCFSFSMDIPQTWTVNGATTEPGIPEETIIRPTPQVPNLRTRTSAFKVKLGTVIRDKVIVTGVPTGPPIKGTWRLQGPAPLRKQGRMKVRKLGNKKTTAATRKICLKYAMWGKAKTQASGKFTINKPGVYEFGRYKIQKPGCYSWDQNLRASWGTLPIDDPAGNSRSEITWAKPGKGGKGRSLDLGVPPLGQQTVRVF
jgi:hypothetical protein